MARDENSEPITFRLLGETEAVRAGRLIPLTRSQGRTIALIALSGSRGITAAQLQDLLPARSPSGERLSQQALQRRIADLRDLSFPIPDQRLNRGRYRLAEDNVAGIDALDFTDGVHELSTESTTADFDSLMALWRENPWDGSIDPAAWPWQPVLAARDKLVERLLALPEDERRRSAQVQRFVGLFPGDATVARLGLRSPGKLRLLVVEDQIMPDLVDLLDSEFEIVPVTSLGEWNEIRGSLVSLGIRAALVDLHLKGLSDYSGATVVAAYLRRHTEIPVVLMSVEPPPRMAELEHLRKKHRLLDIVRKDSLGRLNDAALIEAAQSLVDLTETGCRRRLTLWVESDIYHAPSEECRLQGERLLIRSRRMPLDELEREVNQFHRRWSQVAEATTS